MGGKEGETREKEGEVLALEETVEQRVHGTKTERAGEVEMEGVQTGALGKVVYNTHWVGRRSNAPNPD